MNIISRAICRVIAVLVTAIGILNLIDAIYAGAATNAESQSQSLSMSATIGESVTVELNSAVIELNINPTSEGTFVKTSSTSLVSVYTNSPSAFNINMSANNTKLTSGEGTGAPFIDSITENKTCGGTDDENCANFTVGRWGYSTDGITYHPIPASNHPDMIYEGSKNSIGQTNVPVVFGVKLDLTTATGVYTGTLNFAVTAARVGDEIEYIEGTNPPVYAIAPPCEGVKANDICYTNMQDLADNATAIKNAMVQDQQYQLKDSRDNKTYWVAKLADGNIWMTQNLDHDIDPNYDYNSTNTDVPEGWSDTLVATYETGDSSWDGSYTTPESYDPGNLCWNGTLDTSWSGNLDNMTESCSEGSHYQIGNYYNWTAAVAMENSEEYWEDGLDADQSICPAGWRLPTYSGDKSYANLISEIGNVTSGTSGNIQNNPLYFVYGGYWGGSSYGVGSDGYYWSSVVDNDYDSCNLNFDVDGYLDPQHYYNRDYGISVRCVAR